MKNLNKIDSEIYGVGCSKSFQSLETLCFENLSEWAHWNPMEENEHVERFPHLQNLSISRCPKLSGRLPQCLPLLEKLVISECEQLVVSFSKLPVRLCSLEINRCKGIVCSIPNGSKSLNSGSCENLNFPVFKNWPGQIFQKIEKLRIVGCDELVHLWPNEIGPEKPPQGFHNFSSLKDLYLHELPNLISVPDGFLSIPSILEIINCNALTSLHEGLKHNNPRLEWLKLEGCPSLIIIVRGRLPSSLKELQVFDCKNLSCVMDDREDSCCTFSPSSSCSMMPKEDVDKTSTSLLNNLYIFDCPSLTCLSTTDRPSLAALRRLHITRCSNLKILFSREQLSKALEYIFILKCPKLESIVDRFDDKTSLERTGIAECKNLKSIPEGLQTLSSLREFRIFDCPSLLLFPEGGFPNTPNLSISIQNCEKLQALPNRMHTLNSLQRLRIRKCPSVLSFPEEGIPTSLTLLEIGDVNFYNYLTEWGFHNLTSLRELYICDGCVDAVCFPQEDIGKTLPSSLTHLYLSDLPKLKYLSSKAFQNLSSLRSLGIGKCSDLTSLPSLPSSLESLCISTCPNVKSLPSLPSLLLKLSITNCPMLKKLCKRNEGREWSKIADIACVKIDSKFIYDPEEEE